MQRNIIILIMLLLAATLFFYGWQTTPSDIKSITVEELKSKIDNKEDLVLVDVRTPQEYNGPLGHIDGALLMPVQTLADSVKNLEKYKDKTIIVYCRSGNRSQEGTKILQENGFKAINVLGGMKAWNKMEKK